MIQGNVSFQYQGSVSREGGICEQSLLAVAEFHSCPEELQEWRQKGLNL